MQQPLFIGLMSGTSLDGVDAALCAPQEHACPILASHFLPYPAAVRTALRAIMSGPVTLARIAELDHTLGQLYATAVQDLLQRSQHAAQQITAIACHGQTLWHSPDTQPASTWQIGNPHVLAEATGIDVVCDFRRRDMAAGGQGAPLVPLFHQALFQHATQRCAVVNLGGIANLTLLPAASSGDSVGGFDSGPANTLLDALCRRDHDCTYDRDGLLAARGHCNEDALHALLSDPFFQRSGPKSTGPEYFHLAWLDHRLAGMTLDRYDLLATLTKLTARTVADALRGWLWHGACVWVGGGGCHNPVLMHALQQALPDNPVHSTAKQGQDPDLLEAQAFAWLGWRRWQNLPGNMPAVTGAQGSRLLGAWIPA